MSTLTRTPQSPAPFVGTGQYNTSSLAGVSMSPEDTHLTDGSTALSPGLQHHLEIRQPALEHSEASSEASVEPTIFTRTPNSQHPHPKINNARDENLYTYTPLPPPLSLNTNISSTISS